MQTEHGRQYELDPEPTPQPAGEAPKPFNLMLRRPGDRTIYISPGYDDPHGWLDRDFYEGSDERDDEATEWCLSLPHQCDEWTIGYGSRAEVLADARRFRDELDQAIKAMEAAD